jgi:predicted RNA-binding protein (TIGR00451 family)
VVVPSPEATPYADEGEEKREVAMHKQPRSKPFGAGIPGPLDPEQDHFIINGLGPTPLGLDECYPFAQSLIPRLEDLDRGHMGWVGETKDVLLAAHDMMPGIPGPGLPGENIDRGVLQVMRTADWQFGLGAGAVLTGQATPEAVREALDSVPLPASATAHASEPAAAHAPDAGDLQQVTLAYLRARGDAVAAAMTQKSPLRCDRSRKTHKLRTAHLGDDHVLSLRAGDGLFTLKPEGATLLHAALPAPAMRVVVDDDSVAFNRAGKSVFAQFVLSMDAALRPGDECLVVDGKDQLIGLGQALMAPNEVGDFDHGMAVKVRDGFPE